MLYCFLGKCPLSVTKVAGVYNKTSWLPILDWILPNIPLTIMATSSISQLSISRTRVPTFPPTMWKLLWKNHFPPLLVLSNAEPLSSSQMRNGMYRFVIRNLSPAIIISASSRPRDTSQRNLTLSTAVRLEPKRILEKFFKNFTTKISKLRPSASTRRSQDSALGSRLEVEIFHIWQGNVRFVPSFTMVELESW